MLRNISIAFISDNNNVQLSRALFRSSGWRSRWRWTALIPAALWLKRYQTVEQRAVSKASVIERM